MANQQNRTPNSSKNKGSIEKVLNFTDIDFAEYELFDLSAYEFGERTTVDTRIANNHGKGGEHGVDKNGLSGWHHYSDHKDCEVSRSFIHGRWTYTVDYTHCSEIYDIKQLDAPTIKDVDIINGDNNGGGNGGWKNLPPYSLVPATLLNNQILTTTIDFSEWPEVSWDSYSSDMVVGDNCGCN